MSLGVSNCGCRSTEDAAKARAAIHRAPEEDADVVAAPGLSSALGNRRYGALLRDAIPIGAPSSEHEAEADRVADRVVGAGMPAAAYAWPPSTASAPIIRRTCAACVASHDAGDEDDELRRTAVEGAQAGPASASPALSARLRQQLGGGEPLAADTRVDLGARLGADLGAVRIHRDADASTMCRELDAEAFTLDRDIFFDHGRYEPGSQAGRRLLAHELVHTMQGGRVIARAPKKPLSPAAAAKWPAWHQDELAAIARIAGRSDGTTADARWPAMITYLCALSAARASNLFTRLGPTAPGLVGGTDDFAVYVKNKFPLHHARLTAMLDEVGRGTRPAECVPSAPPPPPPTPPPPTPTPPPDRPPAPNLPDVETPAKPPGPEASEGSPSDMCKPIVPLALAKLEHMRVRAIMDAFTSGFGTDVHDLWMTYLDTPKVGTKGTLPPRRVFGDQKSRVVKEFREDFETLRERNRIMNRLAALARTESRLMPPEGRFTAKLPFRDALKESEIMDLPMSFGDPSKRIPGLIAGGPGKAASDAGDDVRNVDGTFQITNLGMGTFRVSATFIWDIIDCVDFCPGNAGGMAAQLITIPLSRLEATPDLPTYDTPFEVIVGDSDDRTFTL